MQPQQRDGASSGFSFETRDEVAAARLICEASGDTGNALSLDFVDPDGHSTITCYDPNALLRVGRKVFGLIDDTYKPLVAEFLDTIEALPSADL